VKTLLTSAIEVAAIIAIAACTKSGGDGAGAPAAASPPAGEAPPPAGPEPVEGPAVPKGGTAEVPPAPQPHVVPDAPPDPPSPVTFALRATGLPDSGMWKCDPVFADVNADGLLDLAAIPRLGTGPRVWLGNGAGSWTDSSIGLRSEVNSCGGGVVVADVNKDGHQDLVVADHCQGVFVYVGRGTGEWLLAASGIYPAAVIPAPNKYEFYVGAEDLDVGDINGDGHLDIVAAGSDEGGINAYLGDGTALNWTRHDCGLPTQGWGNRVMLVDMNADGWLDLVASASAGPRVWTNRAGEGFEEYSFGMPEPSINGLYQGLAVGDVNEDGMLDVVVSNWVDGPEVWFQLGHGLWRKSPDVFPMLRGGATGLALGDLDRDSHLDIVVAGRLDPREVGLVRGVFFLHGDGTGNFTRFRACGLPETGLLQIAGIGLGDIDADGYLDVAVGSGLLVEEAVGDPAIPEQLLVWRTEKSASVSAAAGDP
jgi:hypothetical protein